MPPCAATEWARRGESWKTKLWTSKPSSASEAAAEEPASPAPTTIILYFRLLAGLMSLLLNLCCSHFCASGPEGMLEFKVAMTKSSTFQVPSPKKASSPKLQILRPGLKFEAWRFLEV